VSLSMPLLRERREDIPLLANYFVRKYSDKCNRKVKGISSEARARLTHYDWPVNVLEFENAIERALVLGITALILPEDLPAVLLLSAFCLVPTAFGFLLSGERFSVVSSDDTSTEQTRARRRSRDTRRACLKASARPGKCARVRRARQAMPQV